MTVKPDIVSVCVPPEIQVEISAELQYYTFVKGVWCEKPLVCKDWAQKVQVNYIRRFDRVHRQVADVLAGVPSTLYVWAKDDAATRCHFEDLARWWKSRLIYVDNSGEIPSTNRYVVTTGKLSFSFENGGITEGGFMENALNDLLDAMEMNREPACPAR